MIRNLVARVLVAICLLSGGKAYAHDKWADGTVVPSWVKAACCGGREAHQITMDQVQEEPGGYWKVEGVGNWVPPDRVFASQDGYAWAFYDPMAVPDSRFVHCLFLVENF